MKPHCHGILPPLAESLPRQNWVWFLQASSRELKPASIIPKTAVLATALAMLTGSELFVEPASAQTARRWTWDSTNGTQIDFIRSGPNLWRELHDHRPFRDYSVIQEEPEGDVTLINREHRVRIHLFNDSCQVVHNAGTQNAWATQFSGGWVSDRYTVEVEGMTIHCDEEAGTSEWLLWVTPGRFAAEQTTTQVLNKFPSSDGRFIPIRQKFVLNAGPTPINTAVPRGQGTIKFLVKEFDSPIIGADQFEFVGQRSVGVRHSGRQSIRFRNGNGDVTITLNITPQ